MASPAHREPHKRGALAPSAGHTCKWPLWTPCPVCTVPTPQTYLHWGPGPARVRGQTPQWGRPAGHGATRGAAGLCQGPFPAAQAPGSWSHSLSWAAPTRHWAGPEGQGPAWHPAPRGCSGPGSGEDGEYSPPTGEGKHCTGARCRGQFTPARSRHNPGGLPGGGLTGSLPLVCGHQSDRRSGPGFSLPTGSSRHMASGTGGHGTGVSRGVGPVLGCAL